MEINLLDWRSKNKFIANNRFYAIAATLAVVAAAMTASSSFYVIMQIKQSKANVKLLAKELSPIEQEIKNIAEMQEQIQELVNKRTQLESLEGARIYLVVVWNDIAKVMPDGIVIEELSRKEDAIDLIGKGTNNEQIASLLRNIQSLPWVKDAKLTEIKAATSNNREGTVVRAGLIDFKLGITLKQDIEI